MTGPSDDHGASAYHGASDDHGASAERTRLAWRRTALSAAAVALLFARPAFNPAEGAFTWLAAALAMAGWALLVGLAYHRARGLVVHPPRPGRLVVPAYASITLGFAVLGGLVVML